jgi:hypothetical protein
VYVKGGVDVLGALLTFFRYLFLLLLYVFIFQLAKMMFKGYQERVAAAAPAAGKYRKPERPGEDNPEPIPGAEAGLVVLASPDRQLSAGAVFPLRGGGVTLGRGRDSDVLVPDPFASLEHAHISKVEGQFWLEDLKSSNGTFLNEKKVQTPTVLADGDRVRIGGVTLKFVRWAYEMESGH